MFLSVERKWRAIRVHAVKEPRVGFDLPGDSALPRKTFITETPRLDRLCQPLAKIQKIPLLRLELKLTDRQLFEIGFEKHNFLIEETAEATSLAHYIETGHTGLNQKTKRLLSLIIAYTVLHLNGTSWLQPGWGSSNIKFFQKASSEIPLRPFIERSLPEDSTSQAAIGVENICGEKFDDECCDPDLSHACPTLITLAVILMEIELKKPFRKMAEEHGIHFVNGSDGPILLLDVDQVFNGDEESGQEGWRTQIPENTHLFTAIEKCLDCELWEEEDGTSLDPQTLRSRIYENVVHPLEQHLIGGFSYITLDSVDTHAKEINFGRWGQISGNQTKVQPTPSRSNLVVPPKASSPCITPSPSNIANLIELCMLELGPCKESTQHFMSSRMSTGRPMELSEGFGLSQFFDNQEGDQSFKEEYHKVYDKFVRKSPSALEITPIKIAILDTGVDGDHPIFYAHRELKGNRNFYDASRKKTPDRHGHGTFAASLILDYAPDADLYVIKIADKENASPEARVVVDAINHAVDVWEVNVISMSFGWPSDDFDGQEDLQAAIDKAHAQQVLMFAAASNDGGRMGRAYPASCPESVYSAWLDDSYVCRSGTSYATPILVGISSFLLHYARLHVPDIATKLKRKKNMESLLKRCAQHGPDYSPRDDYFFVELSLNKHNLFGGNLDGINYEFVKASKR
ncbi:pfs domain-containing protein [Colletotrichum plurivorum]|uniref:Pfs domain-containing protein n=1 Tax=Colletotrichum plurivorum TaxID=2175906 RepID=A0A8H6NMT9_9PEZI|nr:pfs domain-containing protein [Colletotrichum plurivorum]